MKTKSLTPNSIALMQYLMRNETIANKVKAAGKEGKSYVIYSFEDNGSIILGETKYKFWNNLIGCKVVLPFESFASCVWDALVDLSTGNNQEALLQGLSKEVLVKAQREKEYDWVVERLVDCFRHVCNNLGNAQPLAGGRGKSGHNENTSRIITGVTSNNQPVEVNVNFGNNKRTFRFPDATGTADLVLEMGVVNVSCEQH